MQGETIYLKSADGANFGCYHVKPQGDRKGGLVLVMEIFGVTDHIKDLCDRFAAEGYEVLSPHIYDRQVPDYQGGYSPDEIQEALKLREKNPMENCVIDVQACIDELAPRGPVFCTGFCYGGSIAFVAACRCDGLAASSGYYGGLIKAHIDEKPKCPTILHFGEHDKSIPMDDVRAIEAAHPDVPVYVSAADHGFQSDRPTHYDEAAAVSAWARTLDLFAANGAG